MRTLSFLLEERAVVIGDLYFKSPTLRWEAGTYRFVFEHDQGRAELPIRLEYWHVGAGLSLALRPL